MEITCPTCWGPAIPMGILGTRAHFRCRNCGDQWSLDVQGLEEVFDEEPDTAD